MKYVIDIPDKAIDFMGGRDHVSVFVEPEYKVGDCKHYALRISKEDIEPYTEPNRETIENEVWDFAISCVDMDGIDFYRCFEHDSVFYLTEYTYSEAKSKYDEWKRKKDEIRVGDEIKIKTSYSADAVVIGMDDYDLFIVWKDGETDRIEPPERKQWVKTGKHFPEVEELLKKITEESNED